MGILYAFLIVLEAMTSFLLIGIIFIQKTKGGMGGMAFGGGMGEAIFGSRMGNVLTKGTVILASIFLVNTTILVWLTANRSATSVLDSVPAQAAAPVQMPSPSAPISAPGTPEPFVAEGVEFPEPVGEPVAAETPAAE